MDEGVYWSTQGVNICQRVIYTTSISLLATEDTFGYSYSPTGWNIGYNAGTIHFESQSSLGCKTGGDTYS